MPNKKFIFTNIGKNSLSVYLLHGFVISALSLLSLSNIPDYLRLIVYIISTFIITIVFTSNTVTNFIKPLLQPKLNVLIKKAN
jgi:fucose 4-O-acetylase-like acetyltransferase